MTKPKLDQAWIEKDKFCKDCGWPIVCALCNDAFQDFIDKISGGDPHWDRWMYCSNKGCLAHKGAGHFQDLPSWIAEIEEPKPKEPIIWDCLVRVSFLPQEGRKQLVPLVIDMSKKNNMVLNKALLDHVPNIEYLDWKDDTGVVGIFDEPAWRIKIEKEPLDGYVQCGKPQGEQIGAEDKLPKD